MDPELYLRLARIPLKVAGEMVKFCSTRNSCCLTLLSEVDFQRKLCRAEGLASGLIHVLEHAAFE